MKFSILWLAMCAFKVKESFWANQGFTEHKIFSCENQVTSLLNQW